MMTDPKVYKNRINGGHAHKNGISYYSDNYAVTVIVTGIGLTTNLQATSTGSPTKRTTPTLLERANHIPVLRGFLLFVSIILASPLGAFLIIAPLSALALFSVLNPDTHVPIPSWSGSLLVLLAWIIVCFWVWQIGKFHGAEHKAIHSLRDKNSLEYDDIKATSRISPFCGTNMVAILVVFVLIPWDTLFGAPMYVTLPLTLGLAGESNVPGRWRQATLQIGLWAQRLTTREPDELEIACAVRGLEALLDAEAKHDQLRESA